ncbi:hypothetical protein WA026_021466 [Henosepilachna vigintioctopunctata]|uniref:Uncharacterized protein n=1 Tax=Henosepilachna vigintioctopunctata TaxID=420089 RepID=A0AAW1UMZ1_9CUCU
MGVFNFTVLCVTSLVLVSNFPLQVIGKTLSEELKDFCNIIPGDQIKNIAQEHIKNDKNFNEAVIFLQGEKWKNLLKEAEHNPEWIELKKHLVHIGLNLDGAIKSFFDFLRTLHPKPNEQKTVRSLRWFFDDVELILPIGKLLAMLHEKKQKSATFQEFYKKLSSSDVHAMFENVRKQSVFKNIMNELKAMGARVDDILDLFYGFMNWDSRKKAEKRALIEEKKILMKEFEDFVELVPWDKLKSITDKHLANDKDFVKAVLYIQSKEFSKLLESIKNQLEYKELRNYLEENDIELEKLFSLLHELLMQAKPATGIDGNDKENSLKPYLDEIEAAMPLADLFLLLEKKMEYSPEFNRFVKKLSDKKVKIMVENLIRLPETVKLLQKLQKMGVKVKQVIILVYAYLGWGVPSLIL